ncbi:MAG TPA: hypothetical protein VN805_14270 [Caulobacteraceae bacterium]|nr:hypothetical protein [Caulobacteraceae bacterium]
MGTEGQLRAVAFKEGDVWVIHGIEYDLVAQTKSLIHAPVAFLETVINTILINQRQGRKALENIKPAPLKYQAMFDQAEVELTPTGAKLREYKIRRPDIKLRAYEPEQAA